MKQILHKALALKALMLSAVLALSVGNVWADTSTLSFSAACNGSGTADDGAAWAITSDGTESNFDNVRGIHYGTGSKAVQYLQLTTSDITGTITQVVVNASDANATGTISVTVGGTKFTTTGSTTVANANPGNDYTFTGSGSGEIVVKIDRGSAQKKAIYVKSIDVTYTTGGGDTPTLENCDLALTGAPIELEFDLYNNASAQVISYTTSSTGAVTIDDSDYATFAIDEEHKTITVTPIAVTPDVVTITVNQAADESFKAGSTTFDLLIDDSTPIPTHTATFSVNGETSNQDFEEGADIEFPENPSDVHGKSFVGWVTEAIVGSTDDTPTFVSSAKMGEADVTYYAVFANVDEGDIEIVTDVLNQAWTGITGTSYGNWSGKTSNSDAVYAGNSAGGNSSIQLRTSSNTGIITTTSGGKVTKVDVVWNSSTANSRSLDIYGSNSAFTSIDNLFPATATKLGSIVNGESTTLNITGDYAYVGIRSNNGALYASSISITWENGTPASYSEYCTTVVEATVARPSIDVETSFTFSTTATITCDTEGAAIKYSYDGENWNDYTEALTITETTTIYAKAVKDENESSIASVTATKNLATPTVAIDATGITNTNVFDGTEAGSLAATVTYNEEDVEGAVVTWSGNNDEVATIDAETGAVTLVAAGTVTFTATYAGNSDYAEKTATYEMTVTNTDPNAPGTENNPYTVAQAIEATPASGTSANVYIQGVVSAFYNTDIMSDGSNYRYYISADGTTETQLLVYRGKGLNNVAFSDADDLQIGDEVVIYGGLTLYKGTAEVAANNYIVSLNRKVLAEAEFSFGETTEFNITIGDEFTAPTLTTAEGFDGTVTYESSNTAVATVDAETGAVTINAVGFATITASSVATENYKAGFATYTIDVASGKSANDLSLDAPASYTLRVGDKLKLTYTTSADGELTWSSTDSEVLSVDQEGNIEALAVGAANIVLTQAESENYDGGYSELTFTIKKAATVYDGNAFVKVTSDEELEDGAYLIVYEVGEVAFDGSLETLDASENTIDVAIVNNQIVANAENKASVFTIESNGNGGYTILSAFGYYIGMSTYANGLSASEDEATNTISIDYEENAVITAVGGCTLRFNYASNQNRFRYYKSGQQAVALYKLTTIATPDPYTRNGLKIDNYGTICLPCDATIEGAELYSIAGVNDTENPTILYLEDAEAIAEAGKPYIFKATATTLTATYSNGVANTAQTVNGLVGSLTGTSVAEGMYILKNNEIRLAGTGVTIGANRAYIDMSKVGEYTGSEAGVKAISIFDTATGINGIDATANGETIYNVAGQRMQKLQKGINIVGGRKVIVK